MAVTADNTWVDKHFEEGSKKLNNGLYIIFRVEGIEAIQNGFILKHYGVTGDKLDLDNHRIVKSTKLENEKIVSTMLNLGIKDGCNLSGMGFVKKDDGIRPFVDVTDGTGTDTIRKRLDNESTINNFFNHNIYDWFIKKKIRDHIRDAHGESDEDDDVGKCLDLVSLKDQRDNIKVLTTLLNRYNGNHDIHDVISNFIENNPALKTYVNHKFQNMFTCEIAKELAYKFSADSNINTIETKYANLNVDNIKGEFRQYLQQEIDKTGTTFKKVDEYSKSSIISTKNLEEHQNLLNLLRDQEYQKPIDYRERQNAVQEKSQQQQLINFYGNKRDESLIIKQTISSGDVSDYEEKIYTFFPPDHTLEQNMLNIINFFKGFIRYFFALPLEHKLAFEYWKELCQKIDAVTGSAQSSKEKGRKDDLFYFLFINTNYVNKSLENKIQGNQTILMRINEMEHIQSQLLCKDVPVTRYEYPYEINNHKNIFKFFYNLQYGIDLNNTKYATTANAYNQLSYLHIVDLIQIYHTMKTELTTSKKQQDVYKYTFDTITKTLQNYFYEIEKNENAWWKNMEKINNIASVMLIEKSYDTTYFSMNDEKIISFVKINNYTKINGKYDLNKWNLTYQPYISGNKNFLKLKVQNYSNHNKNKNFIFNEKEFKTYTFGGFSHVFPPKPQVDDDDDEEDYDEIGEMMETVQTSNLKEKIINGEKVFIFGYGASGAGKTAMLVYNNATNIDGYCIRLAKVISNDFNNKNIAINIKLTIKEYYYGKDKGEQYFSEIELKYNPPSANLKAKIDNSKIQTEYTNYVTNGTNDETVLDSLCESDELFYEKQGKKIPLSFILRQYVTDESKYGKRKIEPTRNNDQSSRSHVIVYIDFSFTEGSTQKVGSLIIADLAGVENPFEPKDSNTIIETFKQYKKKKKILPENFTKKDCDERFKDEIDSIFFKGDHNALKTFLKSKYNPNGDNGYNPPIQDLDGKLLDLGLVSKDVNWDYPDINILEGAGNATVFNINVNSNAKFIEIIKKIMDNENYDSVNPYDGWWETTNNFRQLTIHKNKLERAIENKKHEINNKNKEINEYKQQTKGKYYYDYSTNPPDRNTWINSMGSNGQYKNQTGANKTYNLANTSDNAYDDNYVPKYQKQHFYDNVVSTNTAKNGLLFYQTKWTAQYETNFFYWRKEMKKKYDDLSDLEATLTDLEGKITVLTKKSDDGNTPEDRVSNMLNDIYNNINYNQYIQDFFDTIEAPNDIKNSPTEYNKQPFITLEKMYYLLVVNKKKPSIILREGSNTITDFLKEKIFEENKYRYKDKDEIIPYKISIYIDNGTLKFKVTNKQHLTTELRKEKLNKYLQEFKSSNTTELKRYTEDSKSNIFETISYTEDVARKFKVKLIGKLKNDLVLIPSEDNEKIEEIAKKANSHFLFIMNEVFLRKQEGEYINEQLRLLRSNMFRSMYIKSNELLFTAPNIETNCLSSTCPNDTLENCFMMKCEKVKKKDNYTDVFIDIHDRYFKCKEDDIVSYTKMLKSLNLLIFTVFNISQKNTHIIDTIKNPFYEKDIRNVLSAYKEPTQFIDLTEVKSELLNNNDENKSYTHEITSMFTNATDSDSHESISQGSIKDILNDMLSRRKFKTILSVLDNHNASTPLGTLMFTDNISKFGLDNICYKNEITFDQDKNYTFAIQDKTQGRYDESDIIKVINEKLDFEKNNVQNSQISDLDSAINKMEELNKKPQNENDDSLGNIGEDNSIAQSKYNIVDSPQSKSNSTYNTRDEKKENRDQLEKV